MAEIGETQPMKEAESQGNESLIGKKIKETGQQLERRLKSGKLQIGTAVAALSMFYSACLGGTEVVPGKTINTPPPAGVNVVRLTETPIASPTATIEATKTAQPTKTPETTSTTEAENLHQGYRIELDDKVKALQAEGKALPSGLTVEQYQAIIQEEINKFPKIGSLVVKLYFPTQEAIDSGLANDYFLGVESGGPKILLRADRRGDIKATVSLAELDHEIGGHYFSISRNGEYWQNILTPEEYKQAEQIEYEASHDPNYGLADNQDAFTEYFTNEMALGTNFPQPDASIGAQMASSRKRLLEGFLSGLNGPADKTLIPFLPLVQTQLDEIHEYAATPQMREKADYRKDAVATLDRNQAIVDKISAENPLMAEVYKSIRENGSVLTEQNMANTSSASPEFTMVSFTKGDTFENLSKWGAVMFLERLHKEGNPLVIEALEAHQITAEVINKFIEGKDPKFRPEGVADQIKVAKRVPGSNPPAAKLLTLFENVAKRLSR